MWPEHNRDAHFYMSVIFAKLGPKTFQNLQDGFPSGLAEVHTILAKVAEQQHETSADRAPPLLPAQLAPWSCRGGGVGSLSAALCLGTLEGAALGGATSGARIGKDSYTHQTLPTSALV